MLKPKNIIFDLGGVLVNLDITASIEALKKFNIPNFDRFFAEAQQSGIMEALETGQISGSTFLSEIQKRIGNPQITNKKIEEAWNKMLLDTPKSRLALLSKVKQNYHTYLLSNTNEIHITYYLNNLKKEQPEFDFYALFDHIYLSHELGMKKPDTQIFLEVLKREHIKAEETLFIDDTEQHIKSAASLGINTYWLQQQNILDLFNKNGEWIAS
ncbi:MAG: HAD family phosphatase [Bacteroidales bacterium]